MTLRFALKASALLKNKEGFATFFNFWLDDDFLSLFA